MIEALINFIRQQLDEDERWALAASQSHRGTTPGGEHWKWECLSCDVVVEITDVTLMDESLQCPNDDSHFAMSLRSMEQYDTNHVGPLPHFVIYGTDELEPAVGGYLLRLSPAHVLAEVATKRKILDDCAAYNDDPRVTDGLSARVLTALALLYAGRSGYDESWRP